MKSPVELTASERSKLPRGQRGIRCADCGWYAISADGTDPRTAPCNCPEERAEKKRWDKLQQLHPDVRYPR